MKYRESQIIQHENFLSQEIKFLSPIPRKRIVCTIEFHFIFFSSQNLFKLKPISFLTNYL